MADLGNTAVISPTDGSNGSGTQPSWLGSAAPSTIDDAGRALQGAVAREWENRSYPTATGTAPAFVVTYTVAPATLRSGQTYTFTAHAAAVGTDTLNANTLGAKGIKKMVAGVKTATAANDWYTNDKISCVYDGTDMVWDNRGAATYTVNGQTEETAVAVGDFLGGYDLSGTVERKFSVQNTLKTINGLTEDTNPDEDADFLLSYDTSASDVKKVKPSNLSIAAYPPGLIFGLTMSNAADTANDITVAAGKARDEADTGNIVLAGAITKQIDAAWAVGTNAGGLNTGTVANDTWYEVHLIKRTDTNVVDVMFTTTANRATLPTNYTLQRRIGWVRFGTATFLQFTQVGDRFTLTTQVNDVSASVTATAAAVTLTAPPSSVARFRATLDITTIDLGGSVVTVFSEISEGNVTPSATTGIGSLAAGGQNATATSNDFSVAGHFELLVSSTSTIEHDSVLNGAPTATFDISTFGWIDTRLRFG